MELSLLMHQSTSSLFLLLGMKENTIVKVKDITEANNACGLALSAERDLILHGDVSIFS